jgi:hypothetical protein
VALFIGLLVLITFLSIHQLDAPGAPVLLFWTMVGTGILVGLAHIPFSFHRWGKGGRLAAYVAILGYLVLWTFTLDRVRTAWERTPAGAAEAKQAEAEAAQQKAADDAQAAADRRQQEFQAKLREGQQVVADLQEREDKLERCFTYFGHRLPALETAVKDSLHNPHSFEHVETVAIVPDDHHNDVAMTFRAENGFGALRTAIVKAAVVPETCEIQSIEDPEEL